MQAWYLYPVEILGAVTVILVFPKRAGNVGSVARAMKNFGLSRLRIVSRREPHRSLAARKMALHAADILERVELFPSLADALSDLHVAVGTSGKFIADAPPRLPIDGMPKLAALAGRNRVGLVFGPEDRGLSAAELSLCNHTLCIPSSEAYPSLNLSHAAAIVFFSLYGAVLGPDGPDHRDPLPKPERSIADRAGMERLYADMAEFYREIGFLDRVNPNRMMKVLRGIYDRAYLTRRELNVLLGIIRQSRWHAGRKTDGAS